MKTAIEWLIEQLDIDLIDNDWAINQAKEMERQQLKEMYLKGIENYDPTFKQKEQ